MKTLPAVKEQLLKQIRTKIATANNLQLKDIDFYAEILNSLLDVLDEESQVIILQKIFNLTVEEAKYTAKKLDKKPEDKLFCPNCKIRLLNTNGYADIGWHWQCKCGCYMNLI